MDRMNIVLRERKAIYEAFQRALDHPDEFPEIEYFQRVLGRPVGTLRAVLERLERRDEAVTVDRW